MSPRLSRTAYWLVIGAGGLFYVALAAYALAIREVLFADGSFFAFLSTCDNPWIALRERLPRAGALVPTILPAVGLGRLLSLGPETRSLLYEGSVLALPTLGPVVCFAYLPPERRDMVASPLAFLLAVSLLTFAFPTEVTITAATFWPLLFGALLPTSRWHHHALRVVFALIHTFSHQAMLLSCPVVAAVLLTSARRAERWHLAALLSFAAAAIVLPLCLPPENALLAVAHARNADDFMPHAIPALGRMPMAWAAVLVLVALFGGPILGPRSRVVAGGVLVLGVGAATVAGMGHIVSYDHYVARVLLALALPLAGATTIWAIRRGHDFRNGLSAAAIGVTILSQAAYQLQFSAVFRQYRSALVRTVQASPTPGLLPLAGESPLRTAMATEPSSLATFYWAWLLPYQSIMLTVDEESPSARAVFDPATWFRPFTCHEARGMRWPTAPVMSTELSAQWLRSICRADSARGES